MFLATKYWSVYISSLWLLCWFAWTHNWINQCQALKDDQSDIKHLTEQHYDSILDAIRLNRRDDHESTVNTSQTIKPNDNNIFQNNSIVTLVHLNDSHEQLTVHWAGKSSPVIICLAKNRKISRRNQSSSVYISHDYGKTFKKINNFRIKDGTEAIISTFHISPVLNSFFLFVDTVHNYIFFSKDYGKNFQRIELNFKPKLFQLHHTSPNLILASAIIENSTDYALYLSDNFGFSWKKIQDKIGYFSWAIEGVDLGTELKTIFILRNEPSGLSTILSSPDFFSSTKAPKVWLKNVEEIEINGRFIFATRRLRLLGSHGVSHQLWISVDRKEFTRALIPTSDSPINYHVADVTTENIFLCVTFENSTTHLYTSDSTFVQFTFSLENILYFNSKFTKNVLGLNFDLLAEQEFADLHRVSGIRGTYIVSKWKNSTKKSISDIVSLITFDLGNKWNPIKAPDLDAFGQETNCSKLNNCSLHFVQKYLSLNSNVKPIHSRDSAIGFIIATGVLGTSLKGKQSVYLSIDAGNTWRQVLAGNYLYAFGDYGAVIVAIAHYSRGGVTNELLYSLDDGETFAILQFSKEKIRVYGLLSEPGEKTTVFTIFGSKEKTHDWIVIQANFSSLFVSQCRLPHDYKEWSPHDFESDCLLGSTQIFQRRIGSHKCFNGESFIRPTAKINCPCKHSDYECDFGFIRDKQFGGYKCIPDEHSQNPNSELANCITGQMFNKTRGYRKISGNTCEGGEDDWYSPQTLPCPFTSQESEFILFVQRQEISMISLNSEEFVKKLIVPKSFLSNAIAADFDIMKSCIFWSDISLNRIMKLCLDGKQAQPEILVETELYSVEGVAFNQINRHLYFVNGFKSKVELIDVDATYEGRMRRTIISKPNIEKPRGIAIDPIACYLFVSDWSSSNPAIIRSELDGDNLKVLFNVNTVTWPNGITVDHHMSRVYWVDAKHDYIASSDYDGKDLKYILRGEQAPHPFALGVFKNFIYYDDWNLHELLLINKHNATNPKVVLSDVVGAMDLKIITPFLNNQTNICNKNNTCSHLCIAKPFSSFRCLCPDGLISTRTPDGNELCSCPPNEEMISPGVCKPLIANVTCAQAEFTCDNGNCISRYWKCDGQDDCTDNSDEKACPENQCKSKEFRCKSTGRCVLDLFMCDYERDCPDGSDEDIQMCDSYYPKCNLTTSFQCNNHRCISKSNVCDQVDNCRDGSDELNCSSKQNRTCEDNYFRCANGYCIPKMWRCDGHNDCLDKSDEIDCKNSPCSPNEFSCPGFICIDKSWVCDLENDCIDGVDENNCTISTNDNSTSSRIPNTFIEDADCPDGWFQCTSGKCIPLEWKCDGNGDCLDEHDEIGCPEQINSTNTVSNENSTRTECGLNKFFCYKSNQCILGSYVCDGDNDCYRGEDELNCKTNMRFPCPPTFYSCILSSGCVTMKHVCDGSKDCLDGSDEWGCENSRLPVNSVCLGFFCKSLECINSFQHCDGIVDCFDESDEENCNEKLFGVEHLHVDLSTITSSSFGVSWISPNSSLKFMYLPAYSHYDDETKSYNHSKWIREQHFTFSNLQSGFTYKVSIFCKLLFDDGTENGKIISPTSYIKVTTLSIAPIPPENFIAQEIGWNQVQLKWATPNYTEPIKGYKIYYSPPFPPASKTVNDDVHQYLLADVFEVGVYYTFWATTLTKNLESSESERATLMIGPAATLNDLQHKNITNSSVVLEWKAVPERISKWFIVYRCEEYFPSFVKNLTTYKNEVMVNHLSPGVNYQFKLYPIINNTIIYDGVQDNVISIRTLGPQLPSILVESSVIGSVVSLEWAPPTGINDIEWEYAVFVGIKISDLKLFVRTKDTKVVLRNLFSCEHYIAQVRVIEPFGLGPSLHDHRFNTTFDPASPPKNLKFEIANPEMTKYRISWNSSCVEHFNDKVGYIVSVNDLVCDCEDRFRFQPNNDYSHSFDLSVHYGAVYDIKVSTDHPDARWSDKIVLKPPTMPKVLRPNGYVDEKGAIFIVWKTIDNYPKDYQAHNLRYKVFISVDQDLQKGETIIVEKPPLIHKPELKGSMYYVGISLIDNHGYVGPLSDPYHLYADDPFSMSNQSVKDVLIIPFLCLMLLIPTVYYIIKRVMSKPAIYIANSHYDSRSDSATLASYDNLV
ncbi:hypothetical protein RDWZM_007719, partial [Blomia tropicalis]